MLMTKEEIIEAYHNLNLTNEEALKEGFRLIKKVAIDTEVNLLDNYGFREYTTIETLREYLPSISKVPGREGADASASADGYKCIEIKSGGSKQKTLTMSSFAKMLFDKQSDSARREFIYEYDGLCLASFEHYSPYPTAVIFIPKDQVPKLHPLFEQKQKEKMKVFEEKKAAGENIGYDAISIDLTEIITYVGEVNMICWLNGTRIDPTVLFNKIKNNKIKINK